MSINHSTRSGGTVGISSFFFNMKLCCVFSIESPHKIIPNTIISAAMGFFFLGTQERVGNSHGIRAIIVGASDVLL